MSTTTKQGTIYSELVDFINSIPVGQTYTSKQFTAALREFLLSKGQHRTHGGTFYRVRSYQRYLRSIDIVTNVKRGLWKVNRHIPSWLNLGVLECMVGHRKYNQPLDAQRSRQMRLLKQLRDMKQMNTTTDLKVGDIVLVEKKTDFLEDSMSNSWVRDMDCAISHYYLVEAIYHACGMPLVTLSKIPGLDYDESDPHDFQFPLSSLKKISGMQFVHQSESAGTVYTIDDKTCLTLNRCQVDITWPTDLVGVSYDITEVIRYIKEGTWILQEKRTSTMPKEKNTRYTDTDSTKDWSASNKQDPKTSFKKGDKVVITHVVEGREWIDNRGNVTSWPDAMDEYVGKEVTLVKEIGGDWTMEETCMYYFPTQCMKLVEPKTSPLSETKTTPEPKSTTVFKNGDTVIVTKKIKKWQTTPTRTNSWIDEDMCSLIGKECVIASDPKDNECYLDCTDATAPFGYLFPLQALQLVSTVKKQTGGWVTVLAADGLSLESIWVTDLQKTISFLKADCQ
jgi:hypothetical protein